MDLPTSSAPKPPENDFNDQLDSLRMLLAAMLAAMLCFGGALLFYLYRQVSALNRQRTESTRAVNEFQTNALPKINWFIGSLQAFAKTNPDFTPILAKYNLLPAPASLPPTSPSPSPSPSGAPVPKK
jgi:hypothetical protein